MPYDNPSDPNEPNYVPTTGPVVPNTTDGGYTDPLTGKRSQVGITGNEAVFGENGIAVQNGRWGLSHALSDDNSGASNMSYYGGSRDGAEKDFGRQIGQRNAYDARGPVQANLTNANQSAGYQTGLMGGLQQAVAGDPNSVAQRQLGASYGTANSLAQGSAASARGGAAAQALAARTAGNQVAANQGAQGVASSQLMASEQQAAMGQMSGLSTAMRQAGQGESFGQANLAMGSREMNDEASRAADARALNAARMGMQGGMNHQANRLGSLNAGLGADSASAAAAAAQRQRDLGQTVGAATGVANTVGSIAQGSPGLGGARPSVRSQADIDNAWDK